MSTQALIVRDDSKLSITFTAEAVAMKEQALALSGLIGQVKNADENQSAVIAQVELKRVLAEVEKARKQCKEPILEFGRSVDLAAKTHVKEVEEEFRRISQLAGDFAQLELAKARAAELARNEELTRLERERMAARAQATSHEALDAVDEHFAQQAKDVPVHEPVRAEGQRIEEEWQIISVDVWKLAQAHPTCVSIEPRVAEIKAMLKAGLKVTGVKAEKIVKASVRVGRQPAAINI